MRSARVTKLKSALKKLTDRLNGEQVAKHYVVLLRCTRIHMGEKKKTALRLLCQSKQYTRDNRHINMRLNGILVQININKM